MNLSPVSYSITREEFVSAWRALARKDTRHKLGKIAILGVIAVLVTAGNLYLAGANEAVPVILGFVMCAAIIAFAAYLFIFAVPEKAAYKAFSAQNETWDLQLTPNGFLLTNDDPDIEIGGLWREMALWQETPLVLMLNKVNTSGERLTWPLIIPKLQIGEERVEFIHNRLQIAEEMR